MPKVEKPQLTKKELTAQVDFLMKVTAELVVSDRENKIRIQQLENDLIAYGEALVINEEELAFFRRLYQESNNPYNSYKAKQIIKTVKPVVARSSGHNININIGKD